MNILNLNGTLGIDTLGQNLFNCQSEDGFFNGVLRAQGNQSNANYAKQFSGDKSLKSVGSWYHAIGAVVGDTIEVIWTSPNDIIIRKK